MRNGKAGAVVGSSVYIDDRLVAENVTFTPPTVGFASSEVQALGTVSLPVYPLPEALEASVDFVGTDRGFMEALKPQMMELQFRWAAEFQGTDGSKRLAGHKLFLRGCPSSIPGPGVAMGEAGTNQVTFQCVYAALFIDGEEAYSIDKITGPVRIGGVDVTAELQSLL